MNKAFALILALILLSQALPWTAFAKTVVPITEAELNRALQIAGLRQDPDYPQANADGVSTLRLAARETVYHNGMEPEETWDAQTLIDWLDDKLNKEFYNVVSVFSRADSLLERMQADDPASYAEFTSGEFAGYEDMLRQFMFDTEVIEESAHFLRDRLGDYIALIENTAETLANRSGNLFETEQLRLSQRVREATDALADLRGQVLDFSRQERRELQICQSVIDGETEPEFSRWLHALLTSVDDPQTVNVSANQVRVVGNDTRLSRLGAGGSVLGNADPGDVYITVIDKNEFAMEFHGVDGVPLAGVKATVKDYNNPDTVLEGVSAERTGNIVFDATKFVNDYDYGMELVIEVDASAVGYRSFYIPWALVTQGTPLIYDLTPLTGPVTEGEAVQTNAEGSVKPYAYSCTFNNFDILHNDKMTEISPVNDAQISFVLEIVHAKGERPVNPTLHYKAYDYDNLATRWVEMKPTQVPVRDSDTHTRYVYTADFKRCLATGLIREDSPYFTIRETGERINTKLTPIRAKVDQPIYTGQEPINPMTSVLGSGFGFDFNIPVIGGKFGVNLPFEENLPKVFYDPVGYVTVSWGSSLVPQSATEKFSWKNTEAEHYDKAMKRYEHAVSVAQKKQATGMASNMYRGILPIEGQARMKLDFGAFVAGSGKFEEDGSKTLGAFSFMAGLNVVFTQEYTQLITIGPVPLYIGYVFSLSAGIGVDGFHVTFKVDKDGKPYDPHFKPLKNITITIRISLTATLGFGIKGLASAWVSAIGMINIILALNLDSPITFTITLQAIVSVGFEIFWIKYSRTAWDSPVYQVYPNGSNANAAAGLFAAYANDDAGDDPKAPQVDIVGTEPARYPAMAPAAKVIDTNYPGTDIRAVNYKDSDIIFYIERPTTYCKLGIEDKTHGVAVRLGWYIDRPFYDQHLSCDDYKVCSYDVYNDGRYLHLIAVLARSIDENGKPIPGGTEQKPNIIICYLEFDDIGMPFISDPLKVKKVLLCPWIPTVDNFLSPICGHPKIDWAGESGMGQVEVYGSLFGQNDDEKTSQFDLFYILPDKDVMEIRGDALVHNDYGDPGRLIGGYTYKRVQLHSNMRSMNLDFDGTEINPRYPKVPGFVALEVRNYGQQPCHIVLHDYYMNHKWPYNPTKQVSDGHIRYDINSCVNAIDLAQGNISSFELLQQLAPDGKNFSQTIFYLDQETVGDRVENRLKSIYVAPKTITNTSEEAVYRGDVSITYKDYDLSIPATEFHAVSIGASQYLYWLSTAPKEKDSDPDVWRINGVYYDSSTNAFSDELVIAELTLPDVDYNGKKYPAVPQEITLTDNKVGYITVKPDTGEQDQNIPEATLYKFDITLATSMKLQKAAMIETTALQGDFLRTQFTALNDGNMGIGSFDVDAMLLDKNGNEIEKVETLHAGLLIPAHSYTKLFHGGEKTVATGEQAIYRDKDFQYSPRRHDWTVKENTISTWFSQRIWSSANNKDKGSSSSYVSTDVLVPGSMGCFVGNIKVPDDWHGNYDLRLKLHNISVYDNYLAASALAKSHPELFAEAGTVSNATAAANRKKLAEYGVHRLDYALNEQTGKLELQNRGELVANAGEDAVSLYALEVDAPESLEVNFDVHDIDVSHRLRTDHKGDEILDITLHNYYHNGEAIELTCAMYLDNSSEPVYVSLPYRPEAMAAGTTTTISVPLKALFDPDKVQSARFEFTPRGIKETAVLNNGFTIYPHGGGDPLRFTRQPEDATAQAGEDVTFQVEVAGGKQPYTYQWQVWDPKHEKWVDLPGFTGPTLSRKDIEKKWDGARFRCVVTDAEGTQIISREVTLRVRDGVDTGDHSNLPLYLAVALAALIMLWWMRRRIS